MEVKDGVGAQIEGCGMIAGDLRDAEPTWMARAEAQDRIKAARAVRVDSVGWCPDQGQSATRPTFKLDMYSPCETKRRRQCPPHSRPRPPRRPSRHQWVRARSSQLLHLEPRTTASHLVYRSGDCPFAQPRYPDRVQGSSLPLWLWMVLQAGRSIDEVGQPLPFEQL